MSGSPTVSVVIPALREETVIGETLADLEGHHDADEIIVADGGSDDRTVAIAREAGVRVVASRPGRARQMNAGAAAATGDVILFLHADTRLPPDGIGAIRSAARDGVRAGRFRDGFDLPHPLLRFYAFFTRFQVFSYGDQGIFVTRAAFRRLGGFREDVPFEDMDLYRRLRRRHRPVILPASVVTSARRFEKVGIVRQAAIDFAFIAMDFFRVDAPTIEACKRVFYADVR